MASHALRVRFLYKSVLRLHRGLPDEHMKAIGDSYVKEEFKRHKNVDNPEQIRAFMEAWAKYALDLSKQLAVKPNLASKSVGKSIENLDDFSDEQIAQLYELYEESSKNPQ